MREWLQSNKKMFKNKLISILILILLISGCNKKIEPKPEPTIEFKVKFLEEGNPISAFYSLETYNNASNSFNVLKQGKTENTYTILANSAPFGTYKLTYWTESHYEKSLIIPKQKTDYLNTINLEENDRKGKVKIKIGDNLEKDRENYIIINISSEEGTIKEPSICFDYSSRIITLKPKDDFIICNWVNYSYYPHNNSKYYLQRGVYKCGEYIETCDRLEINKCYKDQIQTKIKAKKCFKIGIDIETNLLYPILAKTMPFFKEEYIKVYLIDKAGNSYNATRKY